jgi:FXSXX-COOH protein
VADVPEDAGYGLIDVSGLSLRDLDKLGDSALSHELRRMLLSVSEDAETMAGHNDSV